MTSTLPLTRDEADRLTADGRCVLFRTGRWAAVDQLGDSEPVVCLDRQSAASTAGRLSSSVFPWRAQLIPPAEFVEAAQPCETCEGAGCSIDHCRDCGNEYDEPCPVHEDHPHWELGCEDEPCCPDCINGKRRIAAVVPCFVCEIVGRACVPHQEQGHTEKQYVTVGHVVVTSGPEQQDDGTWSLGVEVAP